MSDGGGGVLRGILRSYVQAAHAGWPALHPEMVQRVPLWPRMREPELQEELTGFLAAASRPGCPVRVFWKLGPKLAYAGGNPQFALDAGQAAMEDLLGLDDFDSRLPWGHYAATFRNDDLRVLRSDLVSNVIERQQIGLAIRWNRVVKSAIRGDHRIVHGVFVMYETLDPIVGRQLFARQVTRNDPPALAVGTLVSRSA